MIRTPSFLAAAVVALLSALPARGQTPPLYDFSTDTFTHGFTTISSGLKATYSATGGISDHGGSPGGGVVVSGSTGVVASQPNGVTYSLNTGLTYTISVFLKVNNTGDNTATLLELALGQKSFPQQTGKGVGILLNNSSQGLLAAVFQQDPKLKVPTGNLFSSAPAAGDWLKVSLTLTETNSTTGAFTYSSSVDDYGPTGVSGSPTNLYAETNVTFTDAALAGSSSAGWLPVFVTSVGGNALDNLDIRVSGSLILGDAIVSKGDAVPSVANAVFSVPGIPCVNASGDVALRAVIAGVGKNSGITAANSSGIWLYTGAGAANGTLIAQTGKGSAAAPPLGAAFAMLSDPLIDGSKIAFFAKLLPGSGPATAANAASIWTYNGSALNMSEDQSGPAPGLSSDKIASIGQFALTADGSTPFLGTISGPMITGATNGRLWLEDSNSALTPVASSANRFSAFVPLALVGGQARSFDSVGKYGAFLLSKPSDGAAQEICRATPGIGFSVAPVIAVPGPKQTPGSMNNAPGIAGAVVSLLDEPAVDSTGSVAFKFTMKGTGITPAKNTGIAVLDLNNSPTLIAQAGVTSAPGTNSALYSFLSDPVLAVHPLYPKSVAFVGRLVHGSGDAAKNGSNDQGIWSNANQNSALSLIVRKGQAAPGGGVFSSFNQIVLTNDGTVIFQATLSGVPGTANQGIYYNNGVGTYLAARTGLSVVVGSAVKTIKLLKIFTISPYSMGSSHSFSNTDDFVYTIFFTDGSWGVYRVKFI